MNELYTAQQLVLYTEVDKDGNLGVMEIPRIAQNVLTETLKSVGSDNVVLRNTCDAAWVITKSSFRFGKLPFWGTRLNLSGNCTKRESIRLNLEVDASDGEGDPVFHADFEICPIDLTTRRMRKISTVRLPDDLPVRHSAQPSPFERMKTVFTEDDRAGEVIVHWFDLDYSHHTNNTRYIDYLLYTLDPDFLDRIRITDMEIHYLRESMQGDRMEIRRVMQDGVIDFLMNRDDTEVIRARMKYQEI